VQLHIVTLLYLIHTVYFVFCVVCCVMRTENFAAIRYPSPMLHAPSVLHICMWHVTLWHVCYLSIVNPAHIITCTCLHVACARAPHHTDTDTLFPNNDPRPRVMCCAAVAARYLSMISECSLTTNCWRCTSKVFDVAHVTAATCMCNLIVMHVAISNCKCNLIV
jgi:hypothetical protein